MKEYIIKNKILFIILGIIIFMAIVWALTSDPKVKSESPNRSLAQCLKDKGVKFYGASWCGYCNKQKAMFGDSAKDLPYIECGNGSKCAGITGFPTWVFPNGERKSGQVSLDQLRELSGC